MLQFAEYLKYVTGVVHPVGPEDSVVYWRRRLLLALAALITLIVLIRSFTGGENPIPAAALTAPSAEAVAQTPEDLLSSIVASPTSETLQPTAQPRVPVVGCKVTNLAEPGAYWAHGRNASLNSNGARFIAQ